MSEKGWKRCERKIAEILGGRRVPVSGRQRGDRPDIDHDVLSVEAKYRQSIPKWLLDALQQAEASSTDGKIACVVLHADGALYADSLCLIRLEDLADYLREPQTKGDASE